MTTDADVTEPRPTGPADGAAEDFPEAVVDSVSRFLHKPRARGWIHVYAAIVADSPHWLAGFLVPDGEIPSN